MSTIMSGYLYIYKPEHPFAQKKGYIAEHRLIMEKKIGRYLTKEEAIHHINGIKDDNRIENLQLFASHGLHTKRGHPEIAARQREKFKGIHFSPETEFKKGDPKLMGNKYRLGLEPHNKGKMISEELRAKLRIAHKGKHKPNITSFKKGIIPWNKGLKKKDY